MKRELELYVHLPFCVRKCSYCDFLSGAYSETVKEKYIEALKKEMAAVGGECRDYQVVSVFFGGGTPSLLSGEQMTEIMETIRANFRLDLDAEITMEGNPGTFTPENLKKYRAAGINRLSIGCQSVRDSELKILGRIHTFADFMESYESARNAGFENINVDLMSGLPGQTKADWEENLRRIAKLQPEHISAYSLIVEEGTPFYEMELDLPDEDSERWMYEQTAVILREYGYEQYEISNYALPGKACRHNIGYWERKNYLGLGIGAASLMENVRFSNIRNMALYLSESGKPEAIREDVQQLSREEQMEEFMFLGLRMTEGVSKERFLEMFPYSMEEIYGEVLEKYEKWGFLEERDGYVRLTRAGISVSNQVMAEFLLDS